MSDSSRIVAVGLLTAIDLERLGSGLARAYWVEQDQAFEDLIIALDGIPWINEAIRAPRKGADRN